MKRRRPPVEIDGIEGRPTIEEMGTTGSGLPDEALARGETLEDELVSDKSAGRPRLRWGRPRSSRAPHKGP